MGGASCAKAGKAKSDKREGGANVKESPNASSNLQEEVLKEEDLKEEVFTLTEYSLHPWFR
jgi:hypothetical protein